MQQGRPPSAALSMVSYDGLIYSEEALRDMIGTVGIDRVVFGTDRPADMALDGPVSWLWSLESLEPGGASGDMPENPGEAAGDLMGLRTRFWVPGA